MICIHCDGDFNPTDKLARAKREGLEPGRANECIDCASDGPAVMTGVMIYGHKTAGSIQINVDPRITKYMLASSPSAGTRKAMVQTMPKTTSGVHTLVSDVAKRRE